MKKKLLGCATLALMCLMSAPAFANCVCGTVGCHPCEDTEEYLENVGEHIKKQSRRLDKFTKKYSKKKGVSSCAASAPEFWAEDITVLNKNGDVVLYYAELVDDDTFTLSAEQKAKAKTDAKTLKTAGQKIKDKVAAQKDDCMKVLEVDEEVIARMPASGKVKSKKTVKSARMQPEIVWLDAMEQNGNMLIEVGEFIETNMAQ